MISSIIIKLGPLFLELDIFEDMFVYFIPFLKKYEVDELPEFKLNIKMDPTLSVPNYEDFDFRTDLNFKLDSSVMDIKTDFSRSYVDFDNMEGEAYFPGYDIVSVLGAFMFIQFVSSILLLEKKCLLIHAAGIINDGSGYLFSGRSGVGKTTITKKAYDKNMDVLADDCVGINTDTNELFSTFFKDDFDFIIAPFKYCVFLEQGSSLEANPILVKDAVYNLVKNNHTALYLQEDSGPFIGKIIKLSYKALSNVKTFELKSRLKDDIMVILNELETK